MQWRLVLAGIFVALACGCRSGGNGGATPSGSGGAGGAPAEDGGGGGGGGFSRAELLASFGTCAAAGAKTFRADAEALNVAVAALAATPDDATRAAARGAFRRALANWQVMEMMQFGPTAPSSVAGGGDLRDHIYAWPLFARCAVEEELISRRYEAPNFGTVLLVNRRGLATLEYLLFYEGNDTVCTAPSPAAAGWTALSDDERAARKRAYAVAAARDVAARAVTLDEAWDPAQKNFVQTLRTAGSGNQIYRTQQDAIQSVGLALFYLDRTVKDLKLGDPLNDGCTSAACLESRFAGQSKTNIGANLDGLRKVMEGCDADYTGLGFDDLLVAIGATDVATSLRTAAVAAQDALTAITQPDLDLALVENRDAVVALRAAIANITTIIKSNLFTVLNFEMNVIPTDNDT